MQKENIGKNENNNAKLIMIYSRSSDEKLDQNLRSGFNQCVVQRVLSEEALVKELNDRAADLLVLGSDLTLVERETALLISLKKQIKTAVIPGIYESLLANPTTIGEVALVFFPELKKERRDYRLLQRVSALFLLTLLFPLLVLVATCIRLDSGAPVLYKQERVGHNGQIFTLWKFRTMVIDAEAQSGPVFCRIQDQRITRVGRFLRHMHLDELPQLFNIWRGDMNWVGPRPERPNFVDKFRKSLPAYDLRHLIPPGLTGQAQIRMDYDASPEAKLPHDLQHLRSQGIWEGTKVILATIPAIFLRKGR